MVCTLLRTKRLPKLRNKFIKRHKNKSRYLSLIFPLIRRNRNRVHPTLVSATRPRVSTNDKKQRIIFGRSKNSNWNYARNKLWWEILISRRSAFDKLSSQSINLNKRYLYNQKEGRLFIRQFYSLKFVLQGSLKWKKRILNLSR